ncbi:helix-turn-helix domain-containing protein (plasmid) [Nostoc sp. UHCC 0302]|uniref:helix-turn-helix domain-containing protein n=1 Tax=Nostoc sp. UHCC 0302 TaxID=3134896 RepID=UPI00311CD808
MINSCLYSVSIAGRSPFRRTGYRWEDLGLEGLWSKPGRGGKSRWTEDDMVFLEECLEKEPRTYNSVQLVQKLEQERKVNIDS